MGIGGSRIVPDGIALVRRWERSEGIDAVAPVDG